MVQFTKRLGGYRSSQTGGWYPPSIGRGRLLALTGREAFSPQEGWVDAPPIFSFWLRQKEKTGRARSKREKDASRRQCFRFQESLHPAAWCGRGWMRDDALPSSFRCRWCGARRWSSPFAIAGLVRDWPAARCARGRAMTLISSLSADADAGSCLLFSAAKIQTVKW